MYYYITNGLRSLKNWSLAQASAHWPWLSALAVAWFAGRVKLPF